MSKEEGAWRLTNSTVGRPMVAFLGRGKPMQEALLTAKYKHYKPSGRRQALLLGATRRAHLGYDKLLKRIRLNVERLVCQVFALLNASRAGFRNR